MRRLPKKLTPHHHRLILLLTPEFPQTSLLYLHKQMRLMHTPMPLMMRLIPVVEVVLPQFNQYIIMPMRLMQQRMRHTQKQIQSYHLQVVQSPDH
jgi:hypothetical protein